MALLTSLATFRSHPTPTRSSLVSSTRSTVSSRRQAKRRRLQDLLSHHHRLLPRIRSQTKSSRSMRIRGTRRQLQTRIRSLQLGMCTLRRRQGASRRYVECPGLQTVCLSHTHCARQLISLPSSGLEIRERAQPPLQHRLRPPERQLRHSTTLLTKAIQHSQLDHGRIQPIRTPSRARRDPTTIYGQRRRLCTSARSRAAGS